MRLFAVRVDQGASEEVGVLIADPAIIVAGFGYGGSITDAIRDGELDEIGRDHSGGDRLQDPRPAPAIRPGKIVCVGLNYRDHVAEGAGRDVPEWPLLFAKFANAVVADGEPIVRPEGTHALDLEVELGVVIGRRARRVAVEDAMDHVAGYVVVNDVSARDWQGNKAALAPGPEGRRPVAAGQGQRHVPADGAGVRRPRTSSIRLPASASGAGGSRARTATGPASRSSCRTARPPTCSSASRSSYRFISRHITLEPGDVIATGTPSGVGVFRDPPVFLEPGDRVRCEIEGIGSVENPIVDWTDDPRET